MNSRTKRKRDPKAANPAPFRVAEKWRWHQRALLQVLETLQHERDEHTQAIRVPIDHGGEDIVDVANEKSERATLLAEIRLEEAELAEVEAALGRLRDGTYGICQHTGRPISAARLRALPWTRLSTSAAAGVRNRLT